MMIQVESLPSGEWLVTVEGRATTKHTVRVTPEELRRFGGGEASAEQLLRASFRFLLDRESNTSILSAFDLPVIERYFPEYGKEIGRYLKAEV